MDEKKNTRRRRTLGDLNLKIPRIRSGSQFRPAILPPHWKRIDKDYEELLIAMLCNGYSYAQIERSCTKLGLPFSKETLNDSLDFIAEKMDYYKNRPLDKEWIAVFIEACHTQMRDENRKNQKTVIFVACGIKRDGTIISQFFFFQKIFYTTNAVESINSGIERMRKDLGGYFASVRSLEVNLFIQF